MFPDRIVENIIKNNSSPTWFVPVELLQLQAEISRLKAELAAKDRMITVLEHALKKCGTGDIFGFCRTYWEESEERYYDEETHTIYTKCRLKEETGKDCDECWFEEALRVSQKELEEDNTTENPELLEAKE